MKDNFSTQSELYAAFRPVYPPELFDYLLKQVPNKNLAWDCATGNGQVAHRLSPYFKMVYATDISENQLKNAHQHSNIIYKLEAAEQSSFDEQIFDLIVVSQAIHWFNFDLFYKEVKRTLVPGGLFAAMGYGIMHINPKVDAVIHKLYEEFLGKYWDPERRYIEQEYKTIPFPFEEIQAPHFQIKTEWSFKHLIGYLNTWSALQHYQKANERNPIEFVYTQLKEAWGNDEVRTVRFPVILKIGRSV